MEVAVVNMILKNGKLKDGETRIPTKRVQIILSVAMADALASIAKIEGHSASEIIRRLLENHLTGNKAEFEKHGIHYQPLYP